MRITIVKIGIIALFMTALLFAGSVSVQAAKTDLGTLGGTESDAWAINKKGEVTGGSSTASGEWHAFLWKEKDGMTDLGTLGGTESDAWAINEKGQILGGSYTTSGEWHASF